MPWTRLDPVRVAEQLRTDQDPDLETLAQQALVHLREELLSGRYVVVQDQGGRTFIGTPAEAAERMIGHSEP